PEEGKTVRGPVPGDLRSRELARSLPVGPFGAEEGGVGGGAKPDQAPPAGDHAAAGADDRGQPGHLRAGPAGRGESLPGRPSTGVDHALGKSIVLAVLRAYKRVI